MYNMDAKHIGFGRVQPKDVPDFMEITLTEENGAVARADFRCNENETLTRCGETLCGLLPGHKAPDLFLTDNNVIYYNIDPPLSRDELWMASVTVLAAKRAAADWCKKNGVPVPANETGCACLNDTD